MSTKFIEVATTNSRTFVQEIMNLALLGATLPKDSGVWKGIVLRTRLEIDEDVLVEESPVIRVIPKSKEKQEKKEVKPSFTTEIKQDIPAKQKPQSRKPKKEVVESQVVEVKED